MCILLASSAHPKYSLILISNRDEFFERKTQHTCLQKDQSILCPLDMAVGNDGIPKRGTWCGINKNGKIAFVLNLRHNRPQEANLCNPGFSRGSVPTRFLADPGPFSEWCTFDKFASKYPPIRNGNLNLFIGDCKTQQFTAMDSFGLSRPVLAPEDPNLVISNDFIDSTTKWPKIEVAEKLLHNLIHEYQDAAEDELVTKCLELASHCQCESPKVFESDQLTNSNIFVAPVEIPCGAKIGATLPCGTYYGTRSQIVVLVARKEPIVTFVEQVLHDADEDATKYSPSNPKERINFKLTLDSPF
ncbi:LANO_0H21110g1_1 [Lachancea nothofagi CBS 11611]|uniref:LANO_0H21110g1_1 n=1 Tax=Lachancea nothofagi CBS 11611 TaxID=1266666 RepID=A0A1G4KNC3_9SACH|nr:LANO_0H21110g1_1 [Lachancea nothofagi CBS 11611]